MTTIRNPETGPKAEKDEIIAGAFRWSQELRRRYVGPDHILLSISNRGNSGCEFLKEREIYAPDIVGSLLEQYLKFGATSLVGDDKTDDISFTVRACRIIHFAYEAASLANRADNPTGVDFLKGIQMEGENIAAQALRRLGVDIW